VLTELRLSRSQAIQPRHCRDEERSRETDAEISAALADAKRESLPSNKRLKKKNGLRAATYFAGSAAASFEKRPTEQEALESAVAIRSGTESKLETYSVRASRRHSYLPDGERVVRDAALVSDVMTVDQPTRQPRPVLSAKRREVPIRRRSSGARRACQRLGQALENRQTVLSKLSGKSDV